MSATKLFLMLAVFGAGFAVSCQGAVNAGLSLRVGLGAALVVNTVVVLLGTLVLLFAGGPPPTFFPPGTPWVLYLGGLGGFAFILVSAFVFPRLGVGPAMAVAVLGQGAAALAIDHFGWFGLPRHAVSWSQAAGFGLIALGVWLIKH